jgi:hypothetical protein
LVGLIWLHRKRVAWRAALLQPVLHHHKPAGTGTHTQQHTEVTHQLCTVHPAANGLKSRLYMAMGAWWA